MRVNLLAGDAQYDFTDCTRRISDGVKSVAEEKPLVSSRFYTMLAGPCKNAVTVSFCK
jgi:hypothetical protein